jgi:hypothetical protein
MAPSYSPFGFGGFGGFGFGFMPVYRPIGGFFSFLLIVLMAGLLFGAFRSLFGGSNSRRGGDEWGAL